MADIDELKKKLEDGWIKGEPYVFVSYASKDKEKVYEFVYELRKRGINVYIDIELQENISKNWLQNIKERLYDVDCVAMISFLSLNYFRSYACLIEQLVTRSEDLKMEKGKYLENFYIALDDNMSTIQKMEDAVYNNTVAKESQSMAIKMVPEEVNVLKDVMEDNIAVKSKLKKDVRSTIDGLNTAHRVAISMLSYIFKESSYSIQKYGTAGDCAQLMYNNFTNDKNDKINIDVLEKLKEKYNNALSFTTAASSTESQNRASISAVQDNTAEADIENDRTSDNIQSTEYSNVANNNDTNSDEIRNDTETYPCKVITELDNPIRATVIGAGQFSMDISGSTIQYADVALPIKNLPCIESLERVSDKACAICIRGEKSPSFKDVDTLSEKIVTACKELINNNTTLVVILKEDFSKALGQCLRRRLPPKYPFICLDGIECKSDDYIDIGEPIAGNKAVPVVVKTLVFGGKKK